MTKVEILTKARDLIQKGYARFAQGRREDGTDCDPLDGEARSWCAIGAINAASLYNDRWGLYEIVAAGVPEDFKVPGRAQKDEKDPNFYIQDSEVSRLAAYNNYTDQESVVKLFNEAIKKVEANPV